MKRTGGHIGRRAAAVLAASLAAGLVVAPPPARAQGDDDATQLLEEYRPVVAVREQREPCGEGEPYRPVAVDVVFDRDDVVLRDGDEVTTAPDALDLAAAGPDAALDLPGDALRPDCGYEHWFDSLAAEPTIYGRFTTDDDQVVLQYWFFWVYNDWNDRHEGDWEMVQIVFDAPTASEARAVGPSVYAYAQHEGSEVARVDPDDGAMDAGGKVRLVDGTHPVVYPAAGSHAAYFSSSRWFGKSGATGFGCDDTSSPVVQVDPALIVLPDGVPTDGPFAWLSFEGHWGERQPLFNDGPTGPATKRQWDDPVGWVDDEGRDDAVALPFAGSGATDAFCTLSTRGSLLFLRVLDTPILALSLLVVVVAATVLLVRRSSRGLLGRAARTYRAAATTLAPIGGVVVAALVVAAVLQWAVLRWTRLGDVVDILGNQSAWAFAVVALISTVVVVPAIALVIAATSAARSGVGGGAGGALRWATRHRAAFLAALVVLAVIELGVLAVVLIPVALWLTGRWLVAPVACVRDRAGARAGLARSVELGRGHRWRAVGLVVTLALVAAIGGVLGALVLVLFDVGFLGAALVAGPVSALLAPYIALVVVHFHDELAGW